MKDRLSTLLLIPLAAGLLVFGTMSCATPAVKKPDINRPSNTQGSQTSNTSNTSSTSKPKSTITPQKRPPASEFNDSIRLIDSVKIERKAP